MTKPIIPFSALIGRVLAEQRSAQSVTLVQFAKAIGIPKSTWSRIERGESPLEVGHLAYAADLLGISALDVLAETYQRVGAYQAQGYDVVYLRPKDERLGLGKVLLGAAGVAGTVLALKALDDGDE